MKKIISAVLVSALLAGGSTVAYAAEETMSAPGESQEIDVRAKYNNTATVPDVYSVDIVWDDMVFTYLEEGTLNWNAEEHIYEDNTTEGWDKTSAGVKVTNHSNVPVNVLFSYSPMESYGVTSVLSNTEAPVELAAGEENNVENAASTEATLTVSGVPNQMLTSDGIVIGTITIEIA